MLLPKITPKFTEIKIKIIFNRNLHIIKSNFFCKNLKTEQTQLAFNGFDPLNFAYYKTQNNFKI